MVEFKILKEKFEKINDLIKFSKVIVVIIIALNAIGIVLKRFEFTILLSLVIEG